VNCIVELCYCFPVGTPHYVFAESLSEPLTGFNWYRITDVVSDVVYTVDSSNKYERFRLKGQKINSITYFSTGPLSNGNIERVDVTFGNYYRRDPLPLPKVDQLLKNADGSGGPFGRSFFETNTYKMPAWPLDEAENITGFFI
jgi:hypothetical protein